MTPVTYFLSQFLSPSLSAQEIWKKMTPEFNHVAADKLFIWKVCFLDDENLQQTLDKLELVEENTL